MAVRIQTYHTQGSALQTVLFVSDCESCGVVFGIPETFEKRRREDHKSFWCPNGHTMYFSKENEAERLKRQLADAKREAEYAKKDAQWYREGERAARASLSATKGHLTRVKRRAEKGVCIHCNRTFADVAKHYHTKHGEAHEQASCPICRPA